MKVSLEDLQASSKTIEIQGDEEWLQPLYKSFVGKPGSQLLTGTIEIKSEGYGYASIEGELNYTPLVPCSRCADPISWPLSRKLEARFKPSDEMATASEVDLIAEDFDYYYVEDNQVDIQQVIIDAIMTSLPSQLVQRSDDGKSCRVCGKDISADEVYRSKSKEDESPFAILKNLNLPN
ncbi:YceD family protein [Pseudobacteriovorax antillogorgiicola]|uniref:Uncharacterized metal-binding protein YceD, DUF177 family n=1 Tax=Pseudobacteriovorax antillogorgiicola TaxID=1513793 RepID=A0A1Y6C849_9BACT|nr:DUF177 domain-containing protein [Pseudobacteriovorax antillogorgiicola]TCS49396.1 uncharacterized metal-binding protein YceD (DUF177 family) [Pseudobacteriovorax antillogorgiicola]SMF47128.1 Uncharacterized metal-binding protein YceD, DUF177 family [Pseudobacteriovorax antillogorgiicola]